jgi:hypothetical protein
MALFRRRLVGAQKAVAIVIFAALAANQLRYFVRIHDRDSIWRPQNDLPQNDHRKRNHTTTDEKDQKWHLHNPEIVVVNEIIHRAFFGLGHRLHRSAAAYHLAQSLSLPQSLASSTAATDPTNIDQLQDQSIITHLRFHWESCLASDEIRNSSHVGDKEEERKEYNVFRYLFGDDLWKLNNKDVNLRPSPKNLMATKDSDNDNSRKNTSSDIKPQIKRSMIVLRNDVPGYIAGQLYKDLKLPVNYNTDGTPTNKTKPLVPTGTTSSNRRHEYDVILDKVMRSDVDFYHRLVDNYRFHSELQEFQIKHKWNERPLVIGLHLRAGNGENAHFAESGRASSFDADESAMIARLVRLVNMMAIRETKHLWERNVQRQDLEQNDVLKPLLFIATDTAHLLPLIDKMIRLGTMKAENDFDDHSRSRSKTNLVTNATMTQPMAVPLPLEIVTWPQDRLPKNGGVSFDALEGKGERCLEGWKSAVSDALLLSKADVLVAAKRSTFTQSLPLTLGFDRNRKNNDDDDGGGGGANDTASSAAKDDNDLGKTTQQSKETVISSNRRFSFCEVSEPDVSHMTCYMNARTWLFRGEDDRYDPRDKDESGKNPKWNENVMSFSIPNLTSGIFDKNQTHQQVEHKVTVLLPDVDSPIEFEQAREFLRRENTHESESTASGTETYESIFRYGRSKINKKYRNVHKVVSKTNGSWNLIYNAI